jgi:hypothetical protein
MFLCDLFLVPIILVFRTKRLSRMSDFPKGSDIEATRAWLDKEGFEGVFVGWEADALLGLEERHILAHGGENGLMLWGLLNTARATAGNLFLNCI